MGGTGAQTCCMPAVGFRNNHPMAKSLSVVERKKRAVTPERRRPLQDRMLRALKELDAEGYRYQGITVEQLIRKAGISRQSFYVYFEDKNRLLDFLAEDVVRDLVTRSLDWQRLPSATGPGDVAAALEPIVDAYRRHSTVLRALTQMAGADARLREKELLLLHCSSEGLAAAIREGQRQGSMRHDLGADLTARWLIWMIERGSAELFAVGSEARIAEGLEGLAGVIWFALYDS